MPEATPRSPAGTEFMIELVLGAWNSPIAAPSMNRVAAKGG